MFPPIVRWVLVAASLIVAVVAWDSNRVSSYLLIAGALIATVGYWRYGSVYLASRAYRAGKRDRMVHLLSRTSRPELLASKQRIIFEYLSGIAAHERDDFAAARRHFFFATIARRYNKLRARALLQLANTELAMGDVAGARASLATARDIVTPDVQSWLHELEQRIEQTERA